MQPYSDYEIAQRRIAERQKKKSRFRISLIFVAIMVFITLISSEAGICTISLAVTVGLFTISNGLELYYTTPKRAPSEAEVEQEVEWLLGDDWHVQSSTQAYAFAQDRIRKRRIGRWRFVGHLLLFVPLDGLIVITAARSRTDAAILLVTAFIWLVILINHARNTFPSKQTLANRETKYGTTLQYELAHLQSAPTKQKEKLKRGKYYQVGDDGELEEVEDEALILEEKPKRESGGV